MPNFNSPKDAENYKSKVYADRAAETESKKEKEISENRAEKAYRQNRILLIFTIILGFLGLLVDILSNLDSIILNITALLCR